MRAIVNTRIPRGPDGKFLDSERFRAIMSDIGLEPSDIPRPEPAIAASSNSASRFDDLIREYSLSRAGPIILRMPERTDEEKQRKDFAKKTIFYAGNLPNSNTLFMVNRESNGVARFRLLNSKIEDLQEGCEDLIRMIEEYNRSLLGRFVHGLFRKHDVVVGLGVEEKIKIYEHGLEESTISGVVIKGLRRRWRYILHHTGLEVTVFFAGAVLFAASFLLLNAGSLSTDTPLKGHVERFSTAMITTAIVSLISVFNAFRLMPVVQWTASYDES